MLKTTPQRWPSPLSGILLLLGLALLASPSAPAAPVQANKWRQKAQEFEKRGAWLEACRWYDEALRRDRSHAATREAYQRCLRRLHLVMRHRDASYRNALNRLQPLQALDVYEEVLRIVSSASVERGKTSLGQLFQQGLQELRFALDEEAFREAQLGGQKPTAINNFKARLASWPLRKIATRGEAREQVLAVIQAARREKLALRPALICALVQEFTAGACNCLDEYSSFLTPSYHTAVQAALRGKLVGIGAELVVGDDEKLQIGRLYPKGPAADAGLLKYDRIVRINRQPVEHLPAEMAAERLRGNPGTLVELEIVRVGDPAGAKRVVKLARRAVAVPSVESFAAPVSGDAGQIRIGYLRIDHFRETTVHEVKEALRALKADGMEGLLLDLRGNPGGLFLSGVGVAELFLSEGIIVHTQSPLPLREYNRPYRVEGPAPLLCPLVPMVVLVDGDTASAAEVVAGALRELRARTCVMGQTTYGKGSIQCVLTKEKAPLDKLPGGIRLTVARFFSPSNQPYSGRGVTPHETLPVEGEAALRKAEQKLYELFTKPAPSPMPTVPSLTM